MIFNKPNETHAITRIAASFRKNILEPGGIKDAMDMYKNFRGSEPGIEALLRNRGLME